MDDTRMEFTRSVSGGEQHFVLRLSDDGQRADGTISGDWISGSADAHFQKVD